jgi:uncharacterized protein (UPF0333 family)
MASYRAQGSSEYLVLLAVVLIVALVAIALLGGFSGFGQDARSTETKQYWSSTRPFAITGFNQKGDTMYLYVRNQETDRYTITNVSISNASNTTPIIFNGGASKNIEVHGLRACDSVSYDSYEYFNVSIAYDTPYLSSRYIGTKPLIGTCVP